jgi:hypothetical protein
VARKEAGSMAVCGVAKVASQHALRALASQQVSASRMSDSAA